MDLKETVTKKIDEVVDKLKSDKDLMKKFNDNPGKTVEGLLGVDLPEDQIDALVAGIKAKLKLGSLGKLFG